jgi:PAS domain S-box-containing protein
MGEDCVVELVESSSWITALIAALEDLPICFAIASVKDPKESTDDAGTSATPPGAPSGESGNSAARNVETNMEANVSRSQRKDVGTFPLIYVNSAYEKLFGYSKAEATGKSILFTAKTSVMRLIDDLLQARPAKRLVKNSKKNGEQVSTLMFTKPIFDQTGANCYVISMLIDIRDSSAKVAPDQLEIYFRDILNKNNNLLKLLPDTIVREVSVRDESKSSDTNIAAPMSPPRSPRPTSLSSKSKKGSLRMKSSKSGKSAKQNI